MEKTLEPERLAFLDDPFDEALVSAAGAAAGAASAGASSFFFFLTFFSLSACEIYSIN